MNLRDKNKNINDFPKKKNNKLDLSKLYSDGSFYTYQINFDNNQVIRSSAVLAFNEGMVEPIRKIIYPDIYFKKNDVDVNIIETGLGGTLDTTNVLNSDVQVITPISYDHQNVLGNDIESIAKNKAGIIKKGSTVIISKQIEKAFQVIKNESIKNKSELIRSINQLPSNIKFDVIEVFSMKDKPTLNRLFDQYLRKGHFSVMFIDGGN